VHTHVAITKPMGNTSPATDSTAQGWMGARPCNCNCRLPSCKTTITITVNIMTQLWAGAYRYSLLDYKIFVNYSGTSNSLVTTPQLSVCVCPLDSALTVCLSVPSGLKRWQPLRKPSRESIIMVVMTRWKRTVDSYIHGHCFVCMLV
jgi:hypothetical protein